MVSGGRPSAVWVYALWKSASCKIVLHGQGCVSGMQAGEKFVMVLIHGNKLEKLTPGKQCYAVELQLFIVVVNTFKQEAQTRAETESPVNEVPTQGFCS